MDEAASRGWNTSQKRKRFLIATGTEGYRSITTLRRSSSGGATAHTPARQKTTSSVCKRAESRQASRHCHNGSGQYGNDPQR